MLLFIIIDGVPCFYYTQLLNLIWANKLADVNKRFLINLILFMCKLIFFYASKALKVLVYFSILYISSLPMFICLPVHVCCLYVCQESCDRNFGHFPVS